MRIRRRKMVKQSKGKSMAVYLEELEKWISDLIVKIENVEKELTVTKGVIQEYLAALRKFKSSFTYEGVVEEPTALETEVEEPELSIPEGLEDILKI